MKLVPDFLYESAYAASRVDFRTSSVYCGFLVPIQGKELAADNVRREQIRCRGKDK